MAAARRITDRENKIYGIYLRYHLLMPSMKEWAGFDNNNNNNNYFLTDPAFGTAILNTLLLVGGVLAISVGGGIAVALLLDQPSFGSGIVSLLVIAPFS